MLNWFFQDYALRYSMDKVYAKPALIFEKIAVDDALFMRVGQVLPNMDIAVLENIDLYRYAEINELERAVVVKYVEQEAIEEVIGEVYKLLRKHKPRKKKGEDLDIVIEDDLFIIPKVIAGPFIYNELPGLLLKYEFFGSEKLKEYKISAISTSIEY